MADPQGIYQYVDDLKENLPAFEKYLEGETPLISDGFKARLKAHVIDGYKENLK